MNGILRCESLFRADLSDFVGLWNKLVMDVHPIYILSLQIAQGTYGIKMIANVLYPSKMLTPIN